MAVTYIQTAPAVNNPSAGGPISTVFPGSVTSGRLLFGAGAAYNPGTLGASAFSDDQINTWVRDIEQVAGGDPIGVGIYHVLSANAGITNVELAPTGGTFQTVLASEVDMGGSFVVDSPVSNNGSGDTLTLNIPTPSGANNIIFVAATLYSSGIPNPDPGPTGWTIAGRYTNFAVSQTLHVWYMIQSSANSQSFSVVMTASNVWNIVGISFSAGSAPLTYFDASSGLWLPRRRTEVISY